MNNNFLLNAMNNMKESQRNDAEQLAKYKALSAELELKIRERAQALKLIDHALNPEKANVTLREAMQ